jgi:hypothetical protein
MSTLNSQKLRRCSSKPWLAPLLALGLAALACGLFRPTSSSPPEQITATMQVGENLASIATVQANAGGPGAATQPPPGTILFQDDFSNPSSGWNQVNAPNGATDYADGMYRIWVNETNLDVWARPGLDFANVRIEVDALKVGGDRNNRFGVICRLTGANSFYIFLISSDGYYGIGKVINGQFWLLNAEKLQASPAIQPGSALNHIRADCAGSSLALVVNNQKLAEAQDGELQSGDIGLFAGTYATPGVDIRFDNFSASVP